MATGLISLVALIAIWLVRDHVVLLAEMHKLQTETLSHTITHQKMARNLHELRRQGERVLFASNPEERKQALLVVQLVVNSPAFVNDVQVSAVASDAERFLITSEADSHLREGDRAEWLKLTQRLSLLASDISFEGLNLGVADLKDMETLILLNQQKLLVALVLLTLWMLGTLFLIRRTFIDPLRRIHCAIDHIDEDTEPKAAAHSNIREIQVIENSIDAQRLAQTGLRESEARFRTVIEMTLDAIVLHRSGKLLYINPAGVAMFGARSKQELLDKPILELIHPEYHQIALERVQASTEQGIPSSMIEEQYIKLDGTIFDAEVQGQPITLAGQTAVLTTLRDITARKQAEAGLLLAKAEAELANNAKARFLAAASHDLRQPAHALGLLMDRLNQFSIDPQSKGLVASATAAVREMQDMLDGMFDLSRLDSDTTQTQIQKFPINTLFDALRNGFANEATAKGLRFRVRPSKVWLQSDSTLLRRILLNLVSNSIRYTPRGSVLVACRPTHCGTHARIEVWDSGIGIAPEDQKKVFQEFYQVANPQRDRRMGVGVGLSVVERCCRLLALGLSLRSALGAGTHVSITVPLTKATPEVLDEVVLLSSVPSELSCRQVMLIEDDVMGRDALAGLLESWGYSVIAVEGAKMAADRMQKDQPPDLIISDFRLGDGINGIEAVRMLRSLAGQDIAAFVISGDTDAQVRQQVEAAGLVLFSKPVRPAKLRSLLRHLTQVDSTTQCNRTFYNAC